MDVKGTIPVVLLTVAVFAAVFGVGIFVKKAPPKVVQYINWVVSAAAFVSGLAAYATGESVYRYIFFASLIAYFLTIGYKPGQK
ncbi:MAG: hypothetical protein Q7T53_08010 [Deltaproteobacteria bacterium]|nr:hypothetical protein [Deltaproteobacteria bacterium]